MIVEMSKPPALNALYGTNKWGGKYLKAEGRVWKEELMWKVSAEGGAQNWDVPCFLTVKLYTAKHQDNDSVLKLLQDSLQDAGVIKDDYWIFHLEVDKIKVRKLVEERVVMEIAPCPGF
jgi:Holliday junction resolvase RusA-like endonuclease